MTERSIDHLITQLRHIELHISRVHPTKIAVACGDAADMLTRLRARPSPRLEKALHELAIDSYHASGELRHYCRVCSEEWCPGAGEKHTPECPLAPEAEDEGGRA